MSIHQILPFNNVLVRRFLNWKQGDEEDTWRNKAVEILVKKLKKDQQYQQFQIVLNEKNSDSPCITLPRSQDGRLQVSHRKMLPHVMYCRIFRWPDLQSQHELRSVSHCSYSAGRREANKICVNPYHYSRVDHSLYPPVVTPRNAAEAAFTSASPPPQSPMTPGSNYSQLQGSPTNYFQNNNAVNSTLAQIPQPAHEHNHHYQSPPHSMFKTDLNDPFNYSNGQNSAQSLGFAYSSQSPISESSYYSINVNRSGDPIVNLADSPRGSQSFESQTPPPRYVGCEPQLQLAVPMDTADESHQISNNFNETDEGQEHWCKIQYAELNQKIGEPFKGSSPEVFVDGFTNPSVHNRRFSLGVLSNINRNSTIELTRRAIRKGICLENRDDKIYVKNLSESSIFFHSKNCNVENQLHQHAVVKIEPQGSHKIFDQKIFMDLVQEALNQDKAYDRLFHLMEHCIIKLSFVKGWGSIYQRQDVTSTPCWVEICLMKPCALIDRFLQQTGPPTNHITSTS